MRYTEYPPTPRLAALVERFWLLDGVATGAADTIIPDGRVELIFHYGGTFWRHRDGLDPVRQPSSLLVGQMLEPVLLAPAGHAGIAAIRLRPAAARTLLRFRLREVSGQFVDLDAIFPTAAMLRERLAEASCDAERIAALEGWLFDMACPEPRLHVDAAVTAILQSSGRMTIESLASLTGVGMRQLERQFHDEVGLTPKAFSRVVRLQAALWQIREGRPLSETAVVCGYFDQAHMTRDFQQLAAMSPGMWQTHAGDLAPLFVSTS